MNRMHLLAIVSILTIIGIGLCYGSYEIEVMADGSTSQISATDGASSIASILDTHDKAETTGTKLFKVSELLSDPNYQPYNFNVLSPIAVCNHAY